MTHDELVAVLKLWCTSMKVYRGASAPVCFDYINGDKCVTVWIHNPVRYSPSARPSARYDLLCKDKFVTGAPHTIDRVLEFIQGER